MAFRLFDGSQQQLQQQHDRSQPVYLNFHETVSVGDSSFAVSVPRSWSTVQLQNGETARRRFKFTELNVTPGFYSQRASVLGVDADSIVQSEEGKDELSLRFAVGYSCGEALYYEEKADGSFEQSPFLQGNESVDLEDFVNLLNQKFETLIPAGFSKPPCFVDWVDASWYISGKGEPPRYEQTEHDSADETVTPPVNPSRLVGFYREQYYGIDELADLGPFEDALPASVRHITGVNNFMLPTSAVRGLRLRLHVAPNVTVSFSSSAQFDNLGFTDTRRTGGKKFQFVNAGWGNEYLVFTGGNPPLQLIPKSSGRITCKSTKNIHVFEEQIATFPAGSWAENWLVLEAFQTPLLEGLQKSGLTFPQIRYNRELNKFRFEHPANEHLSLFVRCDPRLSERLGFGPVVKIGRTAISSVMRDGTSKVEAETLAKALVFDAGMCLVTLDETYSNDTYGIDDFSMTTLWPTDSGTFRMSDTFSRSAFLPTVISSNAQNLIELGFTVSTLKQKSVRVPLSWPVNFFAEGTLEGNV